MRKGTFISVAAVVMLLSGLTANAGVLLYDGFTAGGQTPGAGAYQSEPASTDGLDGDSLIGQGPGVTGFDAGVNWGGEAGEFASVVYPRVDDTGLTYSSLVTTPGAVDFFRDSSSGYNDPDDKTVWRDTNLTGALPSDGIYVSMLVSFVAGSSGDIGLTQGLGAQFERDLLVGVDSSGQPYVGDTAGSGTHAASAISAGTTHLLVAKFYENNSADLWVDPVDLSAEGTPDLDGVEVSFVGGNDTYSLDRLKLRRRGTAPGSSVIFDEIRVGTSWDDVTPVPEPMTLTMVALGGAALLRRRRA